MGLPGHEELIVFIDDSRGIEVIERHRSIHHLPAPQRVCSYAQITPWLDSAGFPMQALIVRPSGGADHTHIRKAVVDAATLKIAISGAVSLDP